MTNQPNNNLVDEKTLASLGMTEAAAGQLARQINSDAQTASPHLRWERISHQVLGHQHPFDVHQHVYDQVFGSWDDRLRPRPVWTPTDAVIAQANITTTQQRLGLGGQKELYQWSVAHGDEFWAHVIEALNVKFSQAPTCIRDVASGVKSPSWLPGARLNIAETCFQADHDVTAIVQGEPSGQVEQISYGELRELANRVVHGLDKIGLLPGDAVAIIMPMTIQAVAIYLGVVLRGCVVTSIADSFSPQEIASRIKIANVKLVFTVDVIIRGDKTLPMYQRIVESDAPNAVVLGISERSDIALRGTDITWQQFLSDIATCLTVDNPAQSPINILFSSGTTGEPKAIPFDHTTAIKAACDGYFHHDIHPGDVVAWPTNLGWMMGPWLIFATLMNRGTMALYNGAPTTRDFGKFIEQTRVNMLGLVPSMVRQWRATKCMEGLDWSAINLFSSSGECSNPQDMFYLSYLAGYKPIIEYCGGTEIGGGYIASSVVQPNVLSAFSTPALGGAFVILDEHGRESNSGELFLLPPSMGLSGRLLKGDHDEVYFDDVPVDCQGRILRRHGDQIEQLPGGYYRAIGRADDTMNLGGIKVGAAEIERVLAQVKGVNDVAAIAIAPPEGGPSQLVVFVVASNKLRDTRDELYTNMQQAIKGKLNPLFKISDVCLMDNLPRTASNKVIRRQLRDQYQTQR